MQTCMHSLSKQLVGKTLHFYTYIVSVIFDKPLHRLLAGHQTVTAQVKYMIHHPEKKKIKWDE